MQTGATTMAASEVVSSRRGFLFGLGAALAAPAIVRATSLMPVRQIAPRLIIYSNRIMRSYLDIEMIRDMNVLLRPTDYAGAPLFQFHGVPLILPGYLSSDAGMAAFGDG